MKITVTKGMPYPLGTWQDGTGIYFSYVSSTPDCGVVLFDKEGREEKLRIPFLPEYAVGDIYSMRVSGLLKNTTYCFYEGDRLVTDERGHAFLGGRVYGEKSEAAKVRLARLLSDAYDWEKDQNPGIPYEDCIGYCLHVRGFTRHASSKVTGKGCFKGLMEKIPYLKELGVTTLELQPVYEFAEKEILEDISPFRKISEEKQGKLNYWGYKKGLYYSPKNSYSYSKDPVKEFKDLIKELHKNDMEAVLQFFFTPETRMQEIPAILRFWLEEYHVDGFHLMGENIPADVIAKDPALATSKLWYYGFEEQGESTRPKNLAIYQDTYKYDMRRFLKGDENMTPAIMFHMRRNPAGFGQINFLTNYEGFTMMDLVSYDRKHNEDNGEENKDGSDYNASWNCGQEGATRKKVILQLRKKQIRNAWMLLLLSQGMPLFFMGDEFGNTQKGNNNPYCQDSDVTWLNWRGAETNSDLLSFVKGLIAIRKAHPILHQEKELRLMDYGALGYPDLSYHGEAPWRPDAESYSRQLGMMYCGKYAHKDKKTVDDFFYVAYNMHWEPHEFALPKLEKGMQWEICLASDEGTEIISGTELPKVVLPARCACLLISRMMETEKRKKK